jgi:C-terminal processing protease CtpA/Prc
MKYIIILPLFLLLTCGVLCADTILLKDGQELKGVVVEEYHDRLIFSTERGEICLLKKDTERVIYDTPEENYVKLGAFYRDKGDYNSALYYYEAAYKLNPDLKNAKEGVVLITNMIFRRRQADLEKEVALKQDIENTMGKTIIAESVKAAGPSKETIDELWKKVGIAIGNTGYDIKVNKVLRDSSAYECGVRAGDIIVSIWGKLIKYMKLSDVYGLFLDRKVSELRLAIERDKVVILKKGGFFGGAESMIGGKLGMEFEGLTVVDAKPGGPLEKTGITKGDRIVELGGSSTRYMPLESVYKLVEETKGKSVRLKMQREITFWKR